MTEIIVDQLSLHYGKHKALQNVSFKLIDGKIYGLLGRNGAGKTSLLSLLASFREQTSGTILIDGEEPFENAKAMQKVCFVYQKSYKEDPSTVKSSLEDIERYRPNYDKELAYHLLKRFNIPLDKKVKALSKGMQSALSVTLGLASRAPITIFDEAYLGMDAPTREIFYKELLEDQLEHPRIIILSTHLVSEMDHLFNDVLILHKGQLLVHEEYETFITRGVSITGEKDVVDEFTRSMNVINVQQLGTTKSVKVYSDLSENKRLEAKQLGLEIGTIPLQDLFIYLTEGE